ncbi:MAG: DUF4097 family beta strand repeat protein [Erysipelotrichaceae bacterium]|nr:DUF4097 family beta strand repeat protein [Erysipelotrichaceae bacterium]
MNKSVYLFVLTVVTIFVIIAGTFKQYVHLGISPKEEIVSSIDDSVTSINIDAKAMDITIKVGAPSIRLSGNSDYFPTYDIDDDRLTITQNEMSHVVVKSTVKLTLTLSQTQLKSLNIQMNAGDIRIENIDATYTSINDNAGDVKVMDAKLGQTVIQLNAGDVKLNGTIFTNFTVNNNAGDIKINDIPEFKKYDVRLSTSVGDIKVNGDKLKSPYQQIGNNDYFIDISTNLGDIKISS